MCCVGVNPVYLLVPVNVAAALWREVSSARVEKVTW